jgi:hypothetical protein
MNVTPEINPVTAELFAAQCEKVRKARERIAPAYLPENRRATYERLHPRPNPAERQAQA